MQYFCLVARPKEHKSLENSNQPSIDHAMQVRALCVPIEDD